MSYSVNQILLKHWGYSAFRPMQEEIIESVMAEKDTLALLPTGGGKSICYQVPALAMDGICLVISPLIALMKDQVDNLKQKGIKAVAIHSGMHREEIEIAIGNCRYGEVKLLYISPERLATDRMKEMLRTLKVNLLAVDEAHCISQWGYDFRPPYLRIAEIRRFIPGVPILALTATATAKVVKDIQKKLEFGSENVFRKSFERKNLTYMVIREEDKLKRLLKITGKLKGPGIVYVRNRRHTRDIAEFLRKNKISADFYHAGLDQKTRDKKQVAWMEEETRIIVSTNAFGMGIDKPNVRFVVHLDLPDSIEAYFQEAGRAGRDEKPSYAVLLYEMADILDSRHNLTRSFPEPKLIKSVYQALGNYFQLPVGLGKDLSFEFDLFDFSEKNKFSSVVAFSSLKFLEKDGYILLTDALNNPSRILIKTDKETLYRFQVENEFYDHFIKLLLRSYSGIFTEFVRISEAEIARRSGLKTEEVVKHLKRLEKLQILDYAPQTDKPMLVFLQERLDLKDIRISQENYNDRLKETEERLESMISYASSDHHCRSQALLAYFGECNTKRCGKCDVCLERNKISLNEMEFDNILTRIKPMLKSGSHSIEELISAADPVHEDKVIRAIQWLVDNEKIKVNSERKYEWKAKN
ncbi:MAG: ATP-dependent DNA helicase RecQ [bacterium]